MATAAPDSLPCSPALQPPGRATARTYSRPVPLSQPNSTATPSAAPGPGFVDAGTLQSGFNYFRRTFDTRHGGFGVAPKFPRPSVFSFLLREHARTGNQEALDMVLQTLRAMAGGGIHDQLGGGFHRYSVDQEWRVPHFEKMLYDQAQLAVAYLEAFQITGDDFFAGVARGILEYVLRDMTDSEGGFYSAEDADSAVDPAQPEVKTEGAFYLWPEGALEAALPDPAAKDRLLAMRNQRPRPDRDDKILTAWNGLMISAFALAAQVLDEPRYQSAAERAAGFILTRLHDERKGPLLRRYRAGEAAIPGFLEDYAFLVQGLLDLYETAFDPAYVETAIRLTEEQRRLFEDRADGGFYASAAGDASLALRLKDSDDGAEPSGNSVAALNLLRLAQFTAREDFRECAARIFRAFAGTLNASARRTATDAGGVRLQSGGAETDRDCGRGRERRHARDAASRAPPLSAVQDRAAHRLGRKPGAPGRLPAGGREHEAARRQGDGLRLRELHVQSPRERPG